MRRCFSTDQLRQSLALNDNGYRHWLVVGHSPLTTLRGFLTRWSRPRVGARNRRVIVGERLNVHWCLLSPPTGPARCSFPSRAEVKNQLPNQRAAVLIITTVKRIKGLYVKGALGVITTQEDQRLRGTRAESCTPLIWCSVPFLDSAEAGLALLPGCTGASATGVHRH